MWLYGAKKVYEFVVGVHTSLMLSVFLLALGFAVSSENVSILMAWINVSSLLIVEWLYHRHGNTAIKSRELLLYSIIGVAIIVVLSSIHPIVWLPLVVSLYYAFYRCRREVLFGRGISYDNHLCFIIPALVEYTV